jgi:cytochrome c biogenesis protein CcdA
MEGSLGYLHSVSWISYVTVFLGGVATSFTPCVWPLIPLIAGIIGSAGERSRWRSLVLSLSYVLGLAFTFSLLGIFAVLTGRLFGQIQSSPLAHVIVGSIILLFALSLLDVITLPTFWLNRLGAGRVAKKRSVFSVFFMGLASGFVAAPCTVAVLGAVLTYVATTRNIVFGFSLLFTYALGLGTLLVAVGTFTGILTAIPRLERWTGIIQKVIAWAMIILGEFFIFRAGVLSL